MCYKKPGEKSWWKKRRYLIYKLFHKMITPGVIVKEVVKTYSPDLPGDGIDSEYIT